MNNNFEQAEQQSLNDLEKCYVNYLRFHHITDLQHTAINTFNAFDAFAISADTKLLIVEYKRRNIPLNQYTDSIIELEKFTKLKKYWATGNMPCYLVEYDDYVCLWDLSQFYNYNKEFNLNDDHLFCELSCTSSHVNYSHGEKNKQVRYLQFHECCKIIEKS